MIADRLESDLKLGGRLTGMTLKGGDSLGSHWGELTLTHVDGWSVYVPEEGTDERSYLNYQGSTIWEPGLTLLAREVRDNRVHGGGR